MLKRIVDIYNGMSLWQRLLLIVLIALLTRLYVVVNAATIAVDSATDLRLAEAFTEGKYMSGIDKARPPLHPFLVSLIWYVVGDLELSARILSLICGLIVVPLGFVLAKRLYRDENLAFLTALLIAIHPYLIRYSGETLREGLYYLLAMLVILCGLKGAVERKPKYMFLCGVISILGYLNKHAFIGFLIIFSIWIAISSVKTLRHDWAERAKLLLAGWSIFIAGAFVYIVYLYKTSGYITLTGKINMVDYLSGSLLNTFALKNSNLWNFPARLSEAISAPYVAFITVYAVGAFRRGLSRHEQFIFFVALLYVAIHVIVLPERRYFTRLMPLVMPMVAVGFKRTLLYLMSIAYGKAATIGLVMISFIAQMYQGLTLLHAHRLPEKLAGLWLLKHRGKDTTIIARHPIVSFYAKARFVQLGDGLYYAQLRGLGDTERLYFAVYSLRLPYYIKDYYDIKKKKEVLKLIKSFEDGKKGNYELYRVKAVYRGDR